MDVDFSSVADDFFVNLNLQTTMPLPTTRENVLHFYEAVQKQFPSLTSFYVRDSGEYVLEGDRDSGSYRWLELQTNQLAAGYFSPPRREDAYRFHRWLLDRSIYYLGVSGLDVEALDVMFGFNLDYRGNRDAIVAQALLNRSGQQARVNLELYSPEIQLAPGQSLTLDQTYEVVSPATLGR